MRLFTWLSAEEQANTWTHLIATLATLIVAWPLMVMACEHDWTYVLGMAFFVVGMLLMYLSSTLYHVVTDKVHKRRLRVFDHSSIYVMIAGSYSPLCTAVLGGRIGWTLFGFLWVCVLAGVIGKMIALGKHPRLSLTLYLLMGWVAVVVLVPLWNAMPHSAFWWVVTEGLFYTVGAYFFRLDDKHAFYHAIWHVFIMLGSLSHIIALFIILR